MVGDGSQIFNPYITITQPRIVRFAKIWYSLIMSQPSQWFATDISVQSQRVNGYGNTVNVHLSLKCTYVKANRGRRIHRRLRKCWILLGALYGPLN